MDRCPSCDFPVQVEWNTCRRCGAHLPLEMREAALPDRRVLAKHLTPTSSRTAGPTTPSPRANDNLLPRPRPADHNGDNLVPRSPAPGANRGRSSARAGAAAAAGLAGLVTLRRLLRRRA